MRRRLVADVVAYLGLGLGAFIFVGPIVWLFLTSLKPRLEVFDVALPSRLTWRNYEAILSLYPIPVYLQNSLIVAGLTAAATVLLGALAAYAFSRYRFWLSRPMFFASLVLRMLPGIALLVPFYILFARIGLLDKKSGLILANLAFNLPFTIWVLYGFFQDIPLELEEAARVDGASRLGVLYLIVRPLAAPGLAATVILVFINAWNEFNFAVVLTSTNVSKTMPVALAGMMPEYGINWDHLSAAGMLYILPTLALTFLIQRYLVKGLTAGALKG